MIKVTLPSNKKIIYDNRGEIDKAVNWYYKNIMRVKPHNNCVKFKAVKAHSKRNKIYIRNTRGLFLHRILMSYWNKEELLEGEVVYFKNSNGLDVRKKNLGVMTISQHARYHISKEPGYAFWNRYRCCNKKHAIDTVNYQISKGEELLCAVINSRNGEIIPLISDEPEKSFWDAYRLTEYRRAYKACKSLIKLWKDKGKHIK